MHPTELLKGNLQTIVLKVLADYGKMYGYEITQRVRNLSQGRIELTEGALYPTLHKMQAEGLLQTEVVMIGKRVRKYYRITASGKSLVDEKIFEFASFVKTMSQIFSLSSWAK
jgi:PadR family transcriptional regulator, regulatory protein PadR